MPGQLGFFDRDERNAAVSAAGDPLGRLAMVVDFELFRPELEAALERSARPGAAGRPVLMLKAGLQTLCTLSDDQTEYQIRDRLSFIRFVGLALEDRVPDAKTVWLFREQLTRADAIGRLTWSQAKRGRHRRTAGAARAGGAFQRRKPRGKPMPAHNARGNATKAQVRVGIEHVSAAQKCRLGLVIRSVGLARATARLGLANLVTNMRRLVRFKTCAAPT
jgi:IS5 family transposase